MKIIDMILELQLHKNTSKAKLFEQAVKLRLDKSILSYKSDIENSYEYLDNNHDIRILKKLNRR